MQLRSVSEALAACQNSTPVYVMRPSMPGCVTPLMHWRSTEWDAVHCAELHHPHLLCFAGSSFARRT
jgi:hypothetical protein